MSATSRVRAAAVLLVVMGACGGCGGKGGGDEDAHADVADVAQDDGGVDHDVADGPADAPPDPADDGPDVSGDVPDDETGIPDFEWDAPTFPDRYGFFQMQQVLGPTGAVSFAGGDFGDYSAVEPERPLWAGEGCTVQIYRSDPEDPPGFSRLGAGSPITLTGGGGSHSPVSCTHDDASGYSCDVPATAGTTIFGDGGGETITFDAPGDEVQAFTFTVDVPPPAVSTGALSISRAAPYTVSWETTDATAMIIALVVGDYASGLDGGTAIQCQLDLSVEPTPTSFEIPEVALSLLDNTGMGTGGTFFVGLMQIMALQTHSETLGDGTVFEMMVLNGAAAQVNVTD